MADYPWNDQLRVPYYLQRSQAISFSAQYHFHLHHHHLEHPLPRGLAECNFELDHSPHVPRPKGPPAAAITAPCHGELISADNVACVCGQWDTCHARALPGEGVDSPGSGCSSALEFRALDTRSVWEHTLEATMQGRCKATHIAVMKRILISASRSHSEVQNCNHPQPPTPRLLPSLAVRHWPRPPLCADAVRTPGPCWRRLSSRPSLESRISVTSLSVYIWLAPPPCSRHQPTGDSAREARAFRVYTSDFS